MTVDEARNLLKQKGFFTENLWCVDDVQHYAEEHFNLTLSNEQAMQVFEHIGNTHDAEIGVNWEVIYEAIRILFVKKAA